MISNRLIALALVAALVQAWILSVRLSAATGQQKVAAATAPQPWTKQPPSLLHCPEEQSHLLPWSLQNTSASALLTVQPAAMEEQVAR